MQRQFDGVVTALSSTSGPTSSSSGNGFNHHLTFKLKRFSTIPCKTRGNPPLHGTNVILLPIVSKSRRVHAPRVVASERSRRDLSTDRSTDLSTHRSTLSPISGKRALTFVRSGVLSCVLHGVIVPQSPFENQSQLEQNTSASVCKGSDSYHILMYDGLASNVAVESNRNRTKRCSPGPMNGYCKIKLNFNLKLKRV